MVLHHEVYTCLLLQRTSERSLPEVLGSLANQFKTIMVHEERLSEKIYIVSELAQTDLLEYLEVKGALRESVVRRLFYNLASGVNYMHTENVAHRDIKW